MPVVTTDMFDIEVWLCCLATGLYLTLRCSASCTNAVTCYGVSSDYKFRKDEIFKRMKVTTFAQLVCNQCHSIFTLWIIDYYGFVSYCNNILLFLRCFKCMLHNYVYLLIYNLYTILQVFCTENYVFSSGDPDLQSKCNERRRQLWRFATDVVQHCVGFSVVESDADRITNGIYQNWPSIGRI